MGQGASLLYRYPTCLGHYVYEAGYDLERASFDSILIEIVLEGSVAVETEGQKFLAKKNDVVLIDCYQRHRYYSKTGWEALWVHFDGVPARGYYNWVQRINGNVFTLPNVYQVKRHLNSVFEMFHHAGAINEPKLSLELTQCMTLLTERSKYAAFSNCNSDVLDAVLYYISEHLDQDLSVKTLARIVHLSEYYFIRVFRESMGMTPRQYIISVRLDHAKYLLKTTSLSVQDVGYMVGYASESMFCTSFKRLHGMTPTSYRTGGE